MTKRRKGRGRELKVSPGSDLVIDWHLGWVRREVSTQGARTVEGL